MKGICFALLIALALTYKFPDENGFSNGCVVKTNMLREKHGVPNVKNNPEIAQIAKAWAKKMAEKKSLSHSGNMYKGNYLGENTFFASGQDVTVDKVIDSWYSEIKSYHFDWEEGKIGGTAGQYGHFTQTVWNSTKEMGCGYATNGSKFYAACNYYPAGNYIGKFTKNVFPLK